MNREYWDARGGEHFARMQEAEYHAERAAERYGRYHLLAVAWREENVEGWRANVMVCWTEAARAAA